MKKYIQYLPVEGEIKEGKHQPIFKANKLSYFDLETSEKVQKFKNLKGSVELGIKSAKLFLCSRDIEAGDTVMEKGRYIEFEWTMMMDSCIPVEDGRIFKKLGEVSPGAVWIKEGMEVEDDEWMVKDEGEIEVDIREPRTDEQVERYKQLIREWRQARQVILFKCPTCKTFH